MPLGVYSDHVVLQNRGAVVTWQEYPYNIIVLLTKLEAHRITIICTAMVAMHHTVPRPDAERCYIDGTPRNSVSKSLRQQHLKEERRTTIVGATKRGIINTQAVYRHEYGAI